MSLHLVTGSDDNYLPGVLVLIASAAAHTPGLRATVLDNGISAANRARIDALGTRLGIPVRRIEIDEDDFADLPVTRGHLTRSTYLRLLIPALMPDEDRVLYMDCDMVVTDDLSPLGRLPLDDALLAAVPCPSPSAPELADMGMPRGEYVNAGLLVMNLPAWRAEGLADRCRALLSDPSRPLRSEDQSALNLAARGRVLPLPARFNTYADPAAHGTVADLPRDPAVIHYVVGLKPWAGRVPLGRVWESYAATIADLMPPLDKERWKRRLSGWNTRRKVILGAMLGRPKYRARLQVERAIRDMEHRLAAGVPQPLSGR
ncbi:glycosyltransferase family 8 protein [Paracoccus sp. MC1862]|uniref:glycosyltransferase family 8 protein n=1 Tax=Paracoccus sp. MC1862 TaxID=2760307 RepID=UPI001603FF73|nr:glycosyltransferase family 8 protein [Paracoccus sp. MC1862]MBB1498214.1 glycosyltransferase family 8 protein [Paracoccus sp. MC1862]QQO45705.1 glycosyltransferase family 8 protein [Paracoccus sp. MC1862]